MSSKSRVLSILCVCILSSGALCATYGGGSGSPADPYLISTSTHLGTLAATPGDWGMCFLLTADVSAASYTPVTSFTGLFDGGGHSITGFTCTTGTYYIGFFCKVQGAGACVKNLHLVSPTINVPSANYVGAIAGSVISGGVISGCSVTGGSVTGYDQTGGIAGSNSAGSILGSCSSAAVSGNNYAGGIVGRNEQSSTISDCDATGHVSAGADYCGGLAGYNAGTILRCSAGGSVSGTRYAGGLVGCNGDTSISGSISRSFATGLSKGTSYVGGLVGRNLRGQVEDCYAWGRASQSISESGGLVGRNDSSGTVLRCYSAGPVDSNGVNYGGLIGRNMATSGAITASFWDTAASGQNGSAGGTPESTVLMKHRSTYTNALWDFLGESTNGSADTWRMCVADGTYPRLTWEWRPTDLVCPDGVDFTDFASFAQCWLQTGSSLRADFDASGSVDAMDLSRFVSDWLE